MPDDPTPTPPPGDQGMPQRAIPYQPIPGNMQFARCKLQPGQDVPLIAMVYDSPDARVISYWAEEAFVSLAKRMLAFTGTPQLTIADETDLRSLRDVGPFMEGGKQ